MGFKRLEGKKQQQEEGFMVQKLKYGAASLRTRVPGCGTPPPIWRLQASSQHKNPTPEFLLHFPTTEVSARKLCACLWQILPHHEAPLARLGRRRHKKFHQFYFPPLQMPASASNLRRRVAASFAQHHRSSQPNCYVNHSNLAEESLRCNCEVTPTSSLEVKGGIRESSCNLKTTRELLRLLNRIQSIREQHASNISVVKGLKVELDLSRAQIKELKREKQMRSLMKQMAEDKFVVSKNNAHDRLKVAEPEEKVLEDERKLHWRLSQELSEQKSLFYGSLRELERERKARTLLENLCDEFAIRIRDCCQQESRFLKDNSEKNNQNDRLILDISEAWLDERMQMTVAKAGDDFVEMNSVVDKLGFDIETFLRAKRSVNSPKEVREIHPCHHNSLDAFPVKESISAPVNMHAQDTGNAEKEGGQISTEKQVQSKQFRTNTSRDDDERWLVERNSSDKTVIINETEVSTVYEEASQVLEESETMCRGDSCVHCVVRSNVGAVKQRKLRFCKGMKEGALKAKLLEARLGKSTLG